MGQASNLEVPWTQIRLALCLDDRHVPSLFLEQTSLFSCGNDDTSGPVVALLPVAELDCSGGYGPRTALLLLGVLGLGELEVA